jgi:uncharacterized protein (TIGR02118 family)
MIVSFGFLKRKKGLTREQFLHHWEKVHAPLVVSKNIPELRKYIQNHPAKGIDPEFESDIDGIAEMGFDCVETAVSFYRWLDSSPEAEVFSKDGELFADIEKRPSLFLAEEHILKEYQAGDSGKVNKDGLTDREITKMIKSIGGLKRKKGITREQFLYHYEKIHGPMFLAKSMPGLRKYVQYHPAKVEGYEFEKDIDGISVMWFDDIESLKTLGRLLASSPEWEDLRKDSDSFLESENRLPVFLAEEHIMKE